MSKQYRLVRWERGLEILTSTLFWCASLYASVTKSESFCKQRTGMRVIVSSKHKTAVTATLSNSYTSDKIVAYSKVQ